MVARWLRRLADWLDPPLLGDVGVRARVLIREQETEWPDRSGEAKRHQVYARLLKEYPDIPKSRIGLVIETVIAGMR